MTSCYQLCSLLSDSDAIWIEQKWCGFHFNTILICYFHIGQLQNSSWCMHLFWGSLLSFSYYWWDCRPLFIDNSLMFDYCGLQISDEGSCYEASNILPQLIIYTITINTFRFYQMGEWNLFRSRAAVTTMILPFFNLTHGSRQDPLTPLLLMLFLEPLI